MDSQYTLVNPVPPISLLFDTNSIRNASVSLSTDPSMPIYTIYTAVPKPGGDDALYIRDASGGVVASVQPHELFPDKVTFYDNREGAEGKTKISVNKWLRKGTLPNK